MRDDVQCPGGPDLRLPDTHEFAVSWLKHMPNARCTRLSSPEVHAVPFEGLVGCIALYRADKPFFSSGIRGVYVDLVRPPLVFAHPVDDAPSCIVVSIGYGEIVIEREDVNGNFTCVEQFQHSKRVSAGLGE